MKITAGIFLSMLFILNSCGLTGGETTPPASGIYIINTSPDATVSVSANNIVLAHNYTFGNDSGYFLLAPGTFPFKITVSGSSDSIDVLTNFSAGKYYSLFFIDSTSELKTLFIQDKFATDTFSYARIRLFDFCKNSPTVRAIFANKDTASATDTITYSSRIFNDQGTSSTYTNFTPVIPGTYNFSVYTTDSALIKNFNDFSFSADKYYTIYLNGVYENSTLPLGVSVIQHN